MTSSDQPDETTEVPQVGSGAGLADTDYVPLDHEALAVTDQSGRVNDDDPAEVLAAGLEASFHWRPAVDSTQFAAFVRASSAWNNTTLRDQEQRFTTLIPMSSRDWEDWGNRDQQIFPTVTITSETHPPDTVTDFSRVVRIDLATGTEQDPESGNELMTVIGQARVHHSPEGWRIDSFEVRDTTVGEQ